MLKHSLGLVLGVAMLMVCSGSLAADTPSGTFRGFVELANPSSDGTLEVLDSLFAVEADSGVGLGFIYELRRNHRFGFEFGLIFVDFDFNVTRIDNIPINVKFGDAMVMPLMFGVDIHLLSQNAKPDLYIGPLISYNLWGDFNPVAGPGGEMESGFGFGAVVGLDIPFGSGGWQFNTALRYLTMQLDDGVDSFDVNPLFLEVGVGYRF